MSAIARDAWRGHSYRLDGHTAVPCDDLFEWGRWYETANDERRVARTDLIGCEVSTVFLGLDHNFAGGPPLLFETMIFGTGDGEEWRWHTWEEAESGHAHIVQALRNGADLDAIDFNAPLG